MSFIRRLFTGSSSEYVSFSLPGRAQIRKDGDLYVVTAKPLIPFFKNNATVTMRSKGGLFVVEQTFAKKGTEMKYVFDVSSLKKALVQTAKFGFFRRLIGVILFWLPKPGVTIQLTYAATSNTNGVINLNFNVVNKDGIALSKELAEQILTWEKK